MDQDRSKIVELSSTISEGTRKLDDYLREQGLPTPSFSPDAPPENTSISLPIAILKAQHDVLQAASELQALLNGPLAHLTRLASPSVNLFMSLQAIYRYRVAAAFPFDEEISYQELAERCTVDPSDLRRLLRLAIANYIFEEPRKGYIRHNAASKLLASNPLMHQWIGVVVDELWPAGARAIDAMQEWPGSQEPSETGYFLAHGLSFWDALRDNELRVQRFADGMQFFQSRPGFDVSHLFNDLHWTEENCPELLVDIGGSHGSIAIQLMRKFPNLRCIIADMREVVETANVPRDVEGRIEYQAYNFFTPQPVLGADVYFIRSILHEWSDKYAIHILRNLVPAMKPGARLILNEICLPEPGQITKYYEQLLLSYDLSMKHNFNSKERDADEWAGLLTAADPRFKLKRITRSPASILAVIEAIWTPEELVDEPLSSDNSSIENVVTSDAPNESDQDE